MTSVCARPERAPLVQECLPISKYMVPAAQPGSHPIPAWDSFGPGDSPGPSASSVQATEDKARLIHFCGSHVGNKGPPQALFHVDLLHAGWARDPVKTWAFGQVYGGCPDGASSVATQQALLRAAE